MENVDVKTEAIGRVVPEGALRAVSLLEDAGLEAWLVGGCVRDALLGRSLHDVDIASAATWQQTQRVFEAAGCATFETGTQHGTLTVQVDGQVLEVTTYRVDGAYEDARHPSSVAFVRTIDEDLARRDFTVNAMAWHPARGLLDLHGGAGDLQAGVLRAVGDPRLRFTEDALRILRAVRFASQLGFSVEPGTAAGMRDALGGLGRIAVERIAHEISGMLCGEHVHRAMMEHADVVCAALPELAPMVGFQQQSRYHVYDVYEHTAWVVQRVRAEETVRWAALLHDSGKPDVFFVGPDGYGHFYGHARESMRLVRDVGRRLKLPSRLVRDVELLVRYHDAELPPTPKAVKRMLQRLGGSADLFRALCDLKRADALAHAPQHQTGVAIADELETCLDRVLAEGAAFSLAQLAITGSDVIALGAEPGPIVGEVLRRALDAVIDEQVANTREDLVGFARALIAGGGEDR